MAPSLRVRQVMSTRRLVLLTLLLALFIPSHGFAKPAHGWQRKLDHALQQSLKKGNAPQRVIVQAKAGQEEALRGLLKGKGKKICAEHKLIKAFTAELDSKDLQALAGDDSIEALSLDAEVVPTDPTVDAESWRYWYNTPAAPDTKLRSSLGLDQYSITGRSVGVAIIDSGFANKVDFQGRIGAFYDFTQGGVIAAAPYDDYGHGTHVAGLIGSSGEVSNDLYEGVAPGVKLIGLKVLDANGAGYTSTVIAAIEFAVANKHALGIDVINLSLGHPILESAKTDPMVLAVEKAVASGIVVVCSAGNWGMNPTTKKVGYAGITSPGNARSAITVGAADTHASAARFDDNVADYSSRGPSWYDGYAKPDVVAPGSNLISNASLNGSLFAKHPELKIYLLADRRLLLQAQWNEHGIGGHHWRRGARDPLASALPAQCA